MTRRLALELNVQKLRLCMPSPVGLRVAARGVNVGRNVACTVPLSNAWSCTVVQHIQYPYMAAGVRIGFSDTEVADRQLG